MQKFLLSLPKMLWEVIVLTLFTYFKFRHVIQVFRSDADLTPLTIVTRHITGTLPTSEAVVGGEGGRILSLNWEPLLITIYTFFRSSTVDRFSL
jgi:hypothetical protein